MGASKNKDFSQVCKKIFICELNTKKILIHERIIKPKRPFQDWKVLDCRMSRSEHAQCCPLGDGALVAAEDKK